MQKILFDTPNTPSATKDHKRKNNPERLRHTLLICAKNLMLDAGISHLSMQRVADMAGVSKGGLFHHFKSKEALVFGVVELFIAQVNTALLAYLENTPTQKGMFTKAYIRVFFDHQDIGLTSDWAGLIRSLTADHQMNRLWLDWLATKLGQYQHTDDDIHLHTIRCAVDGAWLHGVSADELPLMRDYLLKLVDEVS